MSKLPLWCMVSKIYLSAVFFLSVVGKFIDPTSAFVLISQLIENCALSFVLFVGLAGLEVALAVCVWLRPYYFFSSYVIFVLSLAFLAFHLLRDSSTSCGCMGGVALPAWAMIAICVGMLLSAGLGIIRRRI